MNSKSKVFSLITGFVGLLLIAGHLFVSREIPVYDLVEISLSKEDARSQAAVLFENSPMADKDLPVSADLEVDRDLLRFVQLFEKEEKSDGFIPAVNWRVRYGSRDHDDEQEEPGFEAGFDMSGRLVVLEQDLPDEGEKVFLNEEEAISSVKVFLSSNGINTTFLKINRKTVREEDGDQLYEFSLESASRFSDHVTVQYEFEIRRGIISNFETDFEINPASGFSKDDAVPDIVIQVITAVFWFVVSIFLFVVFVRRLRNDGLEYRRGIWLSVVLFLFAFAMVAVSAWPEWAGVVFGGLFTGMFVGLGAVVAYPTAESLSRDVWKERLVLTDAMFLGKIGVTEFGQAMMSAIFLTGATLSLGSLIQLVCLKTGLGYVEVEADSFWFAGSPAKVITFISGQIVLVFFLCIMVFSFWTTLMRSKIKTDWVLFLVLVPFFVLSGVYGKFVNPPTIGILVTLPIALLWAWVAVRSDLLTSFMMLLGVYMLSDVSLIASLPEGFGGPAGILIGLTLFLIFATGVVLVFQRRSVHDEGHYVPEYVSRLAERERFLQELEIARNVQMKFLPESVPDVNNMDIAAMCKPAMEVGGDYYDLIRMDERHVAIVIGDVSGKGVSAAFYMTMAKGIIKTLIKREVKPDELLTELNEIFCENSPKNVFISLIFGLFDLESNTLTFSRAGHNPLIVRKGKSEAPELLLPRGLAIGLQRGPAFSECIEEETVNVEPGDIFVFYTDGVSESMNRLEEEFGEERLRNLIAENHELSATELMNKITDEINRFIGKTPQHDDFTMVVVKMN